MLEWSMRDWETAHAEHAYERIREALFDQSGVPHAVAPRAHPSISLRLLSPCLCG